MILKDGYNIFIIQVRRSKKAEGAYFILLHGYQSDVDDFFH